VEGLQFGRFTIWLQSPLMENNATTIMKIIKVNKVEHLNLAVSESTIANPDKFLVDISSFLKTIGISQRSVVGKPRGSVGYFMGTQDFDWAPVIIDMFS
ncbi:hypothetical protein PENTCL1PPCAC_7704, partial [Pristionchus entomophagus]